MPLACPGLKEFAPSARRPALHRQGYVRRREIGKRGKWERRQDDRIGRSETEEAASSLDSFPLLPFPTFPSFLVGYSMSPKWHPVSGADSEASLPKDLD